MTSALPSKRQQKPNTRASGQGALAWTAPFYRTSIGAKFLIALTGVGLTGFVIGHLAGNLQIFMGRDKLNAYAVFLKELGPGLWIARIGLLAMLIVHMVLSIRLKQQAAAARPVPYVYETTIQASIASRTMLQTGLVIFAFLLFHLAHYTFGWIGSVEIDGRYVGYLSLRDPAGRHDVYSMTILGFKNPVVALLYIVAQGFLLVHLSHGVGSVFQTLGANSPRWQPTIRTLSWAVALIVGLGNIAIVVAVWAEAIKLPPLAA